MIHQYQAAGTKSNGVLLKHEGLAMQGPGQEVESAALHQCIMEVTDDAGMLIDDAQKSPIFFPEPLYRVGLSPLCAAGAVLKVSTSFVSKHLRGILPCRLMKIWKAAAACHQPHGISSS